MKKKYFLPFLGFGLVGNQIAQAQTIDNPDLIKQYRPKEIKQVEKKKSKLFPIKWKGNIHPHSDALTTKHVLGSSFSIIDGPFWGEGIGAFDGKKNIEAYLEYADPNEVISRFQKQNTELKSDSLRGHL